MATRNNMEGRNNAEYDAAQARGEVATRADGPAIRDHVPEENKIAMVADLGLSR
jgi:hypothetical protein